MPSHGNDRDSDFDDCEIDYDSQESALIDFLMWQPMDEDYFGPEDNEIYEYNEDDRS